MLTLLTKSLICSDMNAESLTPKSTMSKLFTYTEVATCCNLNNYYIVIHDKVYNISKFIDEHP
jgi:cytochrome b involved in lipid metabolism